MGGRIAERKREGDAESADIFRLLRKECRGRLQAESQPLKNPRRMHPRHFSASVSRPDNAWQHPRVGVQGPLGSPLSFPSGGSSGPASAKSSLLDLSSGPTLRSCSCQYGGGPLGARERERERERESGSYRLSSPTSAGRILEFEAAQLCPASGIPVALFLAFQTVIGQLAEKLRLLYSFRATDYGCGWTPGLWSHREFARLA
jgi:hypothetical protein